MNPLLLVLKHLLMSLIIFTCVPHPLTNQTCHEIIFSSKYFSNLHLNLDSINFITGERAMIGLISSGFGISGWTLFKGTNLPVRCFSKSLVFVIELFQRFVNSFAILSDFIIASHIDESSQKSNAIALFLDNLNTIKRISSIVKGSKVGKVSHLVKIDDTLFPHR